MHDRKKLIAALIAAGMTEEDAEQALSLPVEPAPNEPAPKEPAPSEPAPEDPKPDEPAPSDPEPDDSAPSNPEPDDPEPSEPEPDLAAENATLRASLLSALLRTSGMAAGVKPERLGALVKLADVSGVDPLAENAVEQVDAAVAAALAEVPELAPANPAAVPGALGQHPRNTGKPMDAFARGLLG